MLRFKNSLISSTLFAVLLYVPVSASSDDEGLHRLTTPIGGIAFEVVGQVTNFPPAGAGQPAAPMLTSHTTEMIILLRRA